MKKSLESQMNGLQFKSLLDSSIGSLPEGQEYMADEKLENSIWDVFWALSSVRRFELLFYPFKTDASCLVLNDRYGSVTGIICEKLDKVDFLCAFDDDGLVRRRYSARKNLTLLPPHSVVPRREYDYAFANLDYDIPRLHKYVKEAFDAVTDTGTVLLAFRKTLYQELTDILFDRSARFRSFDLFDNGMILLEAVKDKGSLADEEKFDWSSYKDPRTGFYRSPLLSSRWLRRNNLPFFCPDFASDQVADRIAAVKSVEVALLKKLVQVCKKHGLKIYPIYGTLLGATRNGGLISGDDDIDVALLRQDYDRLLSLKDEFGGDYFLQFPESDSCFYGGYAKLRNVSTTAISPQNWWAPCCEGISIDIFPIDQSFADKKAEQRKLKKIRFYQRMLYASCYGTFRNFRDMPLLVWKGYKYLGKLFLPKERQLEGLNRALKAGDSQEKVAIYTHYRDGRTDGQVYFASENFAETFPQKFEGITMEIPCGWRKLLSARYGEAFAYVPPFNEYKLRHGFYDVSTAYGEYKKRFGGLKNPGSIREPVVLFGDGSVFRACLRYYKGRVNIPFLVLLPDEQKKKDAIMGIPVLTFEEFQNKALPPDSYRGIICSGDVPQADELLARHGYKDLYIFWHNRDWMLFANQSAIWKDIRNIQSQEN